ncbi:MAG: hypothetical protein LBJ16_00565 [Holosporaceae bacterium]|jgi:ribonuclease D|nr:hypothetical protein [Holosporaceae bacterium]
MNIILVNSVKSVAAFEKRFRKELAQLAADERFIAVDTEFIREKLETPLLCLVQLATNTTAYIIDALALDISFLIDIFADESLLKVFHSPRQDFELLCSRGLETKNFYDTQLHEKLLGVDEKIGYHHLVKKYLDKNLDKDYCESDWQKRPLGEEQLHYSANDVVHLREVYKKQFQVLRQMNRHEWLLHEQEYYCRPVESIGKNGNAIFYQLSIWRSEHSVDMRLIPDSLLEEISRKGLSLVRRLKNSRRMRHYQLKNFLEFAEKITANVALPNVVPRKNVVVYFLRAILEAKSIEYGIASSLLATGADLENLANGRDATKCLSGWRKEVFGDCAVAFLKGDLSISMQCYQLVLK